MDGPRRRESAWAGRSLWLALLLLTGSGCRLPTQPPGPADGEKPTPSDGTAVPGGQAGQTRDPGAGTAEASLEARTGGGGGNGGGGDPEATTVVSPQLPPLPTPALLLSRSTWRLDGPLSLVWSPVAAATGYEVEVAREESFETAVHRERLETGLTSLASPEPVPVRWSLKIDARQGEEIHARVRATGPGASPSAWASARLVAGLAPPVVLEPAAGGPPESSPRPRLAWEATPGATAYEIRLGLAAGVETPPQTFRIRATPDPSTRPPGPLTTPGDYELRVRALAGELEGDWSEPRLFRFEPGRPRILEPREGESVASATPLVRWEDGTDEGLAGATGFELELCSLDGSGACMERQSFRVEGASHYRLPALADGGRHRVRVRKLDRELWSDTVAFEVEKVVPPAAEPSVKSRAISPSSGHVVDVSVSADGRHLAVVTLEGDESGSLFPWSVSLLERGVGTAEFSPIPGAWSSRLATELRGAWSLSVSWSPERRGTPALVAAVTILEHGGRVSGRLHRIEGWSARGVPILSSDFNLPLTSVTTSPFPAGGRIAFTAWTRRRWETAAGSRPPPAASADRLGWLGTPDIWLARGDGSDLRRVGPGRDPALSRDGRRLAYIAGDPDTHRIVVRDLVTGRESSLAGDLAPNGRLRTPAWCPRGDHLLIGHDGEAGSALLVVRANGNEEGAGTAVTSSDRPLGVAVFLPSRDLTGDFDGVLYVTDRGELRFVGATP